MNGFRVGRGGLWGRTLLAALLALAQVKSVAAEETVCAQVKIEIKQELTLERQAFDAHMRIVNGLDTISLENVSVNVTFADEAGAPVQASSDPNATDAKFFIRLDTMDGIDSVTGGTIAPGATADIHWLIIPAPGASDGVPSGKLYFVGASLDYTFGGEAERVDVVPDSIYVKPMPELTLDYFLTSEVHADDAFTPEVEPPEPFTLGVRIQNNGSGTAKAVKIDSAQPKIVENEQGLLIGFQIVDSQVNEQPYAPTLLIDFGDIPPQSASTGRWGMITTLSGEFVEFDAQFTHADELGGALTSLLQATNAHFLVRDVLVDVPGRDAVRDFLADDGDALRVYESDNVDTTVADQSGQAALSFLKTVGADSHYRLATLAQPGFLYVKLADPFNGRKLIKDVIRSDGKRLPFHNAWLSKTRRDDMSWDRFVNLFDTASTGNYTIVFSDRIDEPLAPVLQFIPDRTTHETKPISFLVEASDPNGTTPYLAAAGLPAGAAFTDRGDGSALFQWTPNESQAGSYPITFTAGDGALTADRTATIKVNPSWDTDGDGMDDAWEMEHFGTLDRDGTGDYDGDGISDLDEYRNGTDPLNASADTLPGETGIRLLNSEWQPLSLSADMESPVIIVGAASDYDAEAGVPQLRGSLAGGYELRFAEWAYLDGEHGDETVAYAALEPGRYRLPDGSTWEVGVVTSAAPGAWGAHSFGNSFDAAPVVFLTAQTSNNSQPVAVRARNVTADGFQLALAFESGETAAGQAEQVGYLAIHAPDSDGTAVVGESELSYQVFSVAMDHTAQNVAGTMLWQEEAQPVEAERPHLAETVAVLKLDRGVFAQSNSSEDPDPAVVRRQGADDSDQDGMPDVYEYGHGFDPYNPADAALDGDGDELSNFGEYLAGTDPTVPDSDGDGTSDGADFFPLDPAESADHDLDGIGNNTDADDDNDGLPDDYELTNALNPLDAADALLDADSDGLTNLAEFGLGTLPLVPDSDGDGTNDGSDAFPLDDKEVADTDGDGIGNNADPDDDGDELSDEYELAHGLDPLNAEDADADVDSDGLSSRQEFVLGTHPTVPDTDGDGAADGDDVFPLDPAEWADNDADGTGNNADTDDDNDGLPDAYETAEGLNPLDAADATADQDLDGLTALQEFSLGTKPLTTDTDGDGHNDGSDVFPLDGSEWADNDADGIGDNADRDDDNDILSDEYELANGMDPFNAADATTDLDGDGLTSLEEFALGTHPTKPDTDGDSVNDKTDVFPLDSAEWLDTDGDGTGNNADLDDDNDGLPDDYELEHGLDPLDSADATLDPDLDGLDNLQEMAAGTEPQVADTDGDGHADGSDVFPLDVAEWADNDADGTGDNADRDDDNDTLSDEYELAEGMNPLDASDAAADLDGDGLSSLEEFALGTKPTVQDTDGDGHHDGIDVFPLDAAEWADNDGDGTGNNADTDDDNDGLPDDYEAAEGLDPLDASDATADPDSDGLTSLQEFELGTKPLTADTDGDGHNDGSDVFPLDAAEWADNDADGAGDNADLDDDNDTLSDEYELAEGMDPLDASDAAADLDGDGLTSLEEFALGTKPTVQDTDGDGHHDGIDVFPLDAAEWADNDGDGTGNNADTDDDNDGLPDDYELSHSLDPFDAADATADQDGDTLTALQEYALGTHPQKADTDGDAHNDNVDVFPLDGTEWADNDGDGIGNNADLDDDNDGLPDAYELQHGLDPLDGSDATTDADGDGFSNMQEYLAGSDPTDPASYPLPLGAALGEPLVDHEWKHIELPSGYVDPLVILGPATDYDPDRGTMQLRGVTPAGFELRFGEWTYDDGLHGTEQARYLVVQRGRHYLPDGSEWEVGRIQLTTDGGWSNHRFIHAFEQAPALYLTVQTTASELPLTARVQSVSPDGFTAALFGEEGLALPPGVVESVGYLAIYSPTGSGSVDVAGLPQLYSVERGQLDHSDAVLGGAQLRLEEDIRRDSETAHHLEDVVSLSFGRDVFAQAVTAREIDTVVLRRKGPADSDADGMRDLYELVHGFDPYSAADAHSDADGDSYTNLDEYLAETDPLDADSFPRQIGAVVGNHMATRIWTPEMVVGQRKEPVVILGAASDRDSDPGVVRIRNLESGWMHTRFEMQFQEWSYLNGRHVPERVPYLLLEQGRHVLADGAVWTAGKLELPNAGEWRLHEFAVPFAGRPQVYLTLQTANSTVPLLVRLRDVTERGFQAAMFTEEGVVGSQAAEVLGFIAVYNPNGVGELPLGRRNQAEFYRFDSGFVDERGLVLGGEGFWLQEEQSADVEVDHSLEVVNVMVVGDEPFAQITTSYDLDPVVVRRACSRLASLVDRIDAAFAADDALYDRLRLRLPPASRERFDAYWKQRRASRPENIGGGGCR